MFVHQLRIEKKRDCEVTDWEPIAHLETGVVGCSTPCGGGLLTEGRQVLQGPTGGGDGCPNLSRTVMCNTQECPPAAVSDYAVVLRNEIRNVETGETEKVAYDSYSPDAFAPGGGSSLLSNKPFQLQLNGFNLDPAFDRIMLISIGNYCGDNVATESVGALASCQALPGERTTPLSMTILCGDGIYSVKALAGAYRVCYCDASVKASALELPASEVCDNVWNYDVSLANDILLHISTSSGDGDKSCADGESGPCNDWVFTPRIFGVIPFLTVYIVAIVCCIPLGYKVVVYGYKRLTQAPKSLEHYAAAYGDGSTGGDAGTGAWNEDDFHQMLQSYQKFHHPQGSGIVLALDVMHCRDLKSKSKPFRNLNSRLSSSIIFTYYNQLLSNAEQIID